jgi:uracil-DNA glycosylase
MTPYTFPFGQPVKTLIQEDRSPKKVFVLGVYASAVHARWVNNDGKTITPALAVASEPCIFWRGREEVKYENAEQIISRIDTRGAGTLVPAAEQFNGPSGRALDELFLKPMELNRDDAWLCDIVPYSCRNLGQAKVIREKYDPEMLEHGLPEATTTPVPSPLCADERRQRILAELRESKARTVILLGDEPIKSFLHFFDSRWNRLGQFEPYGSYHKVNIAGTDYDVLPLVHPRQASQLGAHSAKWYELHMEWIRSRQSGSIV